MWSPSKLIASAVATLLRRFPRTRPIGTDPLILTTRGRWSAKAISTPLFYATDADRLLIAASFAGSGTPPDWYLNLAVHPEVRVTIDGQTLRYRARRLTDAEAEATWPKLPAVYPTLARYRERANRRIRVVELRRSAPLSLAHGRSEHLGTRSAARR